jgi:hypothetical protein
MMLSDDDEEVDTNFDETCPENCDRRIYDAVLGLRERRLDLEDIMGDYLKSIELVKKDYETLCKKDKNLMTALRNTEKEIREFQFLKQKRLNEIDVWIPLKPSQIQCINNDELQLEAAVLFVEDQLIRLRHRIGELHEEKANIRKQHSDLRKMHVTLNRTKKEKQGRLAELEEHLVQVQLLKFGKVVDLDKLEKVGTNKAADEMRDRMLRQELSRKKELEIFDVCCHDMRSR